MSFLSSLAKKLCPKKNQKSDPSQSSDASTVNSVEQTAAVSAISTATPFLVASPMIGQAKPLSEVPDPAFSGGMMGQGIAILPSEGKVYAPFNGKVVMRFDSSKHGIGLISQDGVELLIHVGIDTVKIKQPCFEYHVEVDQAIKKGDLLMTFDPAVIEAEGFSLMTPIIVTNSDQYDSISPVADGAVSLDSNILTIK